MVKASSWNSSTHQLESGLNSITAIASRLRARSSASCGVPAATIGAAPIVSAGTPQDALDRARNREAIAVIEFSPLSNWWVELFHDEALTIFDCLRDKHGRIVALVIGRVAARHVTSDTSFLVLGDGALRRRTEAGGKVQTLALCGNLRLCVSQSVAGGEAAR